MAKQFAPMLADITQEYLKSRLDYDLATGLFTWKIKEKVSGIPTLDLNRWNSRHAGKLAGGLNSGGYHQIKIGTNLYKTHRLVWLYMTGRWPVGQIDHINNDKKDNRFCNLREVNNAENQQNQVKPPSNNTTGFLGVSYHKRDKKFTSQIQVKGKIRYLGSFKTPEEAYQTYIEAKRELHLFGTL